MKTYKLIDKIFSRYKKLGLSLKLFLKFSKFEPQDSYKLYSYKKKNVYLKRTTAPIGTTIDLLVSFQTSRRYLKDACINKSLRILRKMFLVNINEGLQKVSVHALSFVKGKLIQIWKSPNMFAFMSKQYPENFAFLILRILELFAREACKFLKK